MDGGINLPHPGNCYFIAYKFLDEDPRGRNGILVHGKVRNAITGNKTFTDHAWVEIGDMVWDNAYFDIMFPKDAYYRISDARPERKYTRRQARAMALKFGHYGDWHKTVKKRRK